MLLIPHLDHVVKEVLVEQKKNIPIFLIIKEKPVLVNLIILMILLRYQMHHTLQIHNLLSKDYYKIRIKNKNHIALC